MSSQSPPEFPSSHLERVRRFCLALPETSERLSHGEPTFFVHKKVFVMFANNHHNDGRIAIWLPVPAGLQPVLIKTTPTPTSTRPTSAIAAGSASNSAGSATTTSTSTFAPPGSSSPPNGCSLIYLPPFEHEQNLQCISNVPFSITMFDSDPTGILSLPRYN